MAAIYFFEVLVELENDILFDNEMVQVYKRSLRFKF